MEAPKLVTLGKKIDSLSKLVTTNILTVDELSKINVLLTEMCVNDPIFRSTYSEHYASTLSFISKKVYPKEQLIGFPELKRSMIKDGEFVMFLDRSETPHRYSYIDTYIDTVGTDGVIRHRELALIIDKQSEFIKALEALRCSSSLSLDVFWREIISFV